MRICFTCEFCKRGDEANCVKAMMPKSGGGTFQQFAITTAIEATPLPATARDRLAKVAPALCAVGNFSSCFLCENRASQFIEP